MRIWDIDPSLLCKNHLLGEHRELHGLWNILTIHKGAGGYSRHPETLRWVGRTNALYIRHEKIKLEIVKRGYRHLSPLDIRLASGATIQDTFINTPSEQRGLLKNKNCECKL